MNLGLVGNAIYRPSQGESSTNARVSQNVYGVEQPRVALELQAELGVINLSGAQTGLVLPFPTCPIGQSPPLPIRPVNSCITTADSCARSHPFLLTMYLGDFAPALLVHHEDRWPVFSVRPACFTLTLRVFLAISYPSKRVLFRRGHCSSFRRRPPRSPGAR